MANLVREKQSCDLACVPEQGCVCCSLVVPEDAVSLSTCLASCSPSHISQSGEGRKGGLFKNTGRKNGLSLSSTKCFEITKQVEL